MNLAFTCIFLELLEVPDYTRRVAKRLRNWLEREKPPVRLRGEFMTGVANALEGGQMLRAHYRSDR